MRKKSSSVKGHAIMILVVVFLAWFFTQRTPPIEFNEIEAQLGLPQSHWK